MSSIAIVNVPDCVLNSLILIITVIISHYRYNGSYYFDVFSWFVLLCHCVARDWGVNYVRRVYLFVLVDFISSREEESSGSDNHKNMELSLLETLESHTTTYFREETLSQRGTVYRTTLALWSIS